MCGIVGALTFDKFETKAAERIRQEALIYITTQLLQATVERGKDATGVSLLWADGNYTGLKMGIPAPDFISKYGGTEKDFEGILKLWREYPKLLKVFLGHCRKSSVGNSYDNKNNHPIQVGDIIMVHNGTLTNHDAIFENLDCKRDGEVDSEAIARLLHVYTKNGTEPFTMDMLEEVTKRLQGTHSVLAVSGNNPFQVAQFRDTRPAEMVLVRPLKTVFVASKEDYLKNILYEYNKMSKLFIPGFKYPYLKKADVEFKTLQDDSMMLWDLTTKVTDKTEIGDLFDWRKSVPIGQKIWRTYSTGTTYHNRGVKRDDDKTKKAEVNAKSSAGKKDEEDAEGLVWSNALNKYKTQADIDETKDYGSVEVNVDKGEITQLDKDGATVADATNLAEVSKDKVENLLVGAAEIKDVGIKRVSEALGAVADGKKSDDSSSSTPADTTVIVREVDMTQDAEALKKAEDFIEAGFVKYESDDEVAADLNISDSAVVRKLPMFALANRVKKFIFKQGFFAGYLARKDEEVNSTKLLAKVKRAEYRVSTLKLALKIAFKTLEERSTADKKQTTADLLNTVIEEVLKSRRQPIKNLSSTFTVGDLKNIPLLKETKEKMEKIAKE